METYNGFLRKRKQAAMQCGFIVTKLGSWLREKIALQS
jgi:hypothetical protein